MFAQTSPVKLLALSLLATFSMGAFFVGSFSASTLAVDVPTFPEAADESATELDEGVPPEAGIETPPETSGETANYADETVSLDYPATWQVDVDEAGTIGIVNVPETPLDLVDTRLYRVEAPPGPLVDANIDSFISEGAAVSRYRSVTIDEQSALVIWLAERPGELSSAIATFIGYGDETVFLFSRYSPDNLEAEADILNLHGSFSHLADGLVDSSETSVGIEAMESLSAPGDLSSPVELVPFVETLSPVDEDPILPTEALPLQNEEFQL